MNIITKFTLGALTAGALAVTAVAPAEAGVSVGIGIGVPAGPGYGYHRHFCYYHPGACGYRAGYVGAPAIGVYVGGRGYWNGRGWYAHRYWNHGGWRYR